MLIETGYIHVAPSEASAFLKDMETFAVAARARDGCLSFGVAPEGKAAGRMLVAEHWRDQAALSDHLAARETLAFVERWSTRMTGDVMKFDATNERPLLAP